MSLTLPGPASYLHSANVCNQYLLGADSARQVSRPWGYVFNKTNKKREGKKKTPTNPQMGKRSNLEDHWDIGLNVIFKQLKYTINFLGWNGQDFFSPPKWILIHNGIIVANFHGEHAATGAFSVASKAKCRMPVSWYSQEFLCDPEMRACCFFAGMSNRRS